MNKYQKALETLKSKDIKLCVYKDVGYEDQPSLFDLYHSEIFALQELVDKKEPNEIENIFKKSIEKYGRETQCRQAMEECAELIQAINKCLRYPTNEACLDNLVEEIGDVTIMIYELKAMFNINDDKVIESMIKKAKREKERLKL